MKATIKGYRRKGGAVVTVTRDDGRARRYVIGLRRWNWLRNWCNVKGPYRVSGFLGGSRLEVRIDSAKTWKAWTL